LVLPPKDGPSETGRAFGDRAFGDIYEIVLLEQRKKTPAGCFFLMLRELDRFRTIDWAIALRDLKYVPVLQRYLLLNEQGSIAVPG